MRFKNGLVLGTFLPFHKGHELLINFASSYCNGTVLVIMSSRSQEPISGAKRYRAIQDTLIANCSGNVVVYHHDDDNAPQNPVGDNDVAFWDYWQNIIEDASHAFGIDVPEYVFSSEKYGDKVAEIIGAEHIMFDNDRESIKISGTAIRNNPIENSHMINDHMIRHMRKKFVMFGAESCGKSTMTKIMGEKFPGSITAPEYARPYLESQEDKSPSFYNMDKIFQGQFALEQAISKQIGGSLVAFLDTDIMSTFGYADMVGMNPGKYENMYPMDERVYIVLAQDEVPFEPDVLRYGINKRESVDQFWIDILKDFGMKTYVVNGTLDERVDKVCKIVNQEIQKMVHFERE